MITKDQLIISVKDSAWPNEVQAQVLALVPKLGKNTIDFLGREVDTFFSETEADGIVGAIQKVLDAIDALNSNYELLSSILKQAPELQEYDFGRYIVATVADNSSRIKTAGPEIKEAFLEFEAKLFKYLPEEELQEIVKENIVYFASQLELVNEFKRINFMRRIGPDMKWAKAYSYNLENNEEMFGKQQLIIDGKIYKPEIRYWIKDFIMSQPVAVTQRGTFEEIQYLKKSANVTKLTPNEQIILLEIIKLYKWFLEPEVTEAEVLEYEQKIQDKLFEQDKVEVPSEENGTPPSKVPPAAPVRPLPPASSSGFGFQKPVVASPVTPLNIEQLMKRPAAPAKPPVIPLLQKPVKPLAGQDEKKEPISTMSDILRQKAELEHNIDERIETLKKRASANGKKLI